MVLPVLADRRPACRRLTGPLVAVRMSVDRPQLALRWLPAMGVDLVLASPVVDAPRRLLTVVGAASGSLGALTDTERVRALVLGILSPA